MSTLAEIIASRATAGARYSAAVVELKAAWIELTSIEKALTNLKVAGTPSLDFDPFGRPGTVAMLTFGSPPDPISLRHPVYAPDIGGHWPSEADAAHKAIVANAT